MTRFFFGGDFHGTLGVFGYGGYGLLDPPKNIIHFCGSVWSHFRVQTRQISGYYPSYGHLNREHDEQVDGMRFSNRVFKVASGYVKSLLLKMTIYSGFSH